MPDKQPMIMGSRLTEICEAFLQVNAVRATGILAPENRDEPLFKCAFTEVVIYVRDLLEKADRQGSRIALKDNMETDKDCQDVTDLVRLIRDAVCHLDSWKRETGSGFAAFLVVGGLHPAEVLMGFKVSCEFEDDVRIYYGHRGLYLVIRGFQWVPEGRLL